MLLCWQNKVTYTTMFCCLQTYENQKKRAKKASADDKVEVMRTGGGSYVPQVGSVEEKLLAVLGNRAQPLANPFDSDALFHPQPPPTPGMLNQVALMFDTLSWWLCYIVVLGKYFCFHSWSSRPLVTKNTERFIILFKWMYQLISYLYFCTLCLRQ